MSVGFFSRGLYSSGSITFDVTSRVFGIRVTLTRPRAIRVTLTRPQQIRVTVQRTT